LRVLVADDQPGIRKRICLTLASMLALEACDEAANGQEAVEKAEESSPDLIILDVTMPVMNGLDAARRIRLFSPLTPILILTMHKSRQLMEEAEDWCSRLRGKGRRGTKFGLGSRGHHAEADVFSYRILIVTRTPDSRSYGERYCLGGCAEGGRMPFRRR